MKEGIALLEYVYEEREKRYGLDDPSTLISLDNLAHSLHGYGLIRKGHHDAE